MRNLLLIMVLVFSVALVGCNKNSKESPEEELTQNPSSNQQEFVSDLSEETIASKYFEATEADLKAKLIGQKKFALFFYSAACQTCLDIDEEITGKLADLPEDMIIAKVNFETEMNLRREFAITVESSVVTFEADGTVLETLVSPSLDQILISLGQ